MVATLGDTTSGLSTVQKLAAEFKKGRGILEADPRARRPATATTQENIDRVHYMVIIGVINGPAGPKALGSAQSIPGPLHSWHK